MIKEQKGLCRCRGNILSCTSCNGSGWTIDKAAWQTEEVPILKQELNELQNKIEMIIVESDVALDATYKIMDLIKEYKLINN